MVGWLTVKDKTCVTYGSHVNQDSTFLQSAHAPRSSSYKGIYGTITQQFYVNQLCPNTREDPFHGTSNILDMAFYPPGLSS